MTNHTVILDRPSYDDSPRAWYQTRCSCGWESMPQYYDNHPRLAAKAHVEREYDQALKAAWLEVAERGEKFSVADWRAANPQPPLPF